MLLPLKKKPTYLGLPHTNKKIQPAKPQTEHVHDAKTLLT
jgi:hypothetical protein